MRRAIRAACVVFALGGSAAAHAQGGIGLGAFVGEPSGLSLKLWLQERAAFDVGVAWSFSGEDALHIHGNYLLHAYDLLEVPEGTLPVYYGLGARVKILEEDTLVGIRAPVGLAYIFPSRAVDIFLEVVPILDVAPSTEFGLNGYVGARYFFR